MPLDFPTSPALNQVYSLYGKSWKWNGDAWETYNDNLGVDFVETVNGATGDVIITGGTDISVSTVGKTVTVNYTGSGGGGGGGAGAQGTTGQVSFLYRYNSSITGTSGVTGYISGNYDVNTPSAGSNTLYISATDMANIRRDTYWNYGYLNQNTGRVEVGQLYVTSYDRPFAAAYTIGSVERSGSGATAFYQFDWSSSTSATGSFTNGERLGVYYIPGGRLGAAGSKGDAGSGIASTTVTVTTTTTDEGVLRTANLVSTLDGGSTITANLNPLGMRTFTQTTTPAGGMYNGDRWVNTNTGKLYLYTVLTGSTAANQGTWVEYN